MNMGSELEVRSARALARQHSRELDAVYRTVELAEVRVAGVAHVTRRAEVEALQINLTRREAERLAPDGAEHYAFLAAVGVTEMATVITDTRWGR
jgi:hypothetical protein